MNQRSGVVEEHGPDYEDGPDSEGFRGPRPWNNFSKNPEAIVEPSEEEINTAMDTLRLPRDNWNSRLVVRRVFLDFMRYRMSMAQNELWKTYGPSPSSTAS